MRQGRIGAVIAEILAKQVCNERDMADDDHIYKPNNMYFLDLVCVGAPGKSRPDCSNESGSKSKVTQR